MSLSESAVRPFASGWSASFPTSRRPTVESKTGFTLIELLVVIAIIVLLIGILLPVFARVRANARSATCLINERSIALAVSTYSQSNAGRLPSPRTDAGSASYTHPVSGIAYTAGSTGHTWVKTSVSGGLVTVDGVQQETEKSLQGGVLWTYLDSGAKAYRSPNDPTNRVRSYSMSSYIGNRFCPDDWDPNNQVPLPNNEPLATDSMTKIPRPSQTLAVIVDEARTSTRDYNFQGWLIDWASPYWIDTPAFWDESRVNIALVDGSTKTLTIFSEQFVIDAGQDGDYLESDPAGAWYAMRGFLLPGRCDL
jgi:prepilin-type N-terminal cleavage/methylation domain-containing protein